MSKKIIFCVINDLVFDQRMQRICTTLANNNFHTELVGRILGNSKPVATFPFLQTRLTCFFNKGFLFYAANSKLGMLKEIFHDKFWEII